MWKTLLSKAIGFFSGNVLTYIEIGLAAVVLFCVGYTPWHWEHNKFLRYQEEQTRIVKEQLAENQAKKQQHDLIVKGLQDELAAKTIILRRYYANGLRPSSPGTLLSRSATTPRTDAEAKYTLLAGQCAEITLKYELLQKYERERLGLPDDEQ
jgi:hypothetical protein